MKLATDSQFFPLQPFERARFIAFCGVLDEHLQQIGKALSISLAPRGEGVIALGHVPAGLDRLLQTLYDLALELTAERITQTVEVFVRESRNPVTTTTDKPHIGATNSPVQPLLTRRADLQARTPLQQQYLAQIARHTLTFGIGPAGTGKTYLAVAAAVDALERERVKRLILTRPAVEAGERLGFLPGDLAQKIDPYLRPLYDALYELLGVEKTQRLFEKQVIELAPLAYMRGRTLSQAFIILDEAQNTTPEQMKMFLTRIGYGSKVVITGDLTQVDLPHHPQRQQSGLAQACAVLSNVTEIAFTQFTSKDVVRHPLVASIVNAYEQWQQTSQPPKNSST